MDSSRGRGRGSNPWNRGGRQNIASKKDVPKVNVTAKLRFEEAQARLQASVQKHIKPDYESSSEEDELESDNILGSVLKSYSQLGGKSEDLGRTQRFLEDAFQSGAATCLICIASVKRNEAVIPNVAMSMISRARQSAIRVSAVKPRILRTILGWFHTPVERLVAVPYNRCAAMTVFYFVIQRAGACYSVGGIPARKCVILETALPAPRPASSCVSVGLKIWSALVRHLSGTVPRCAANCLAAATTSASVSVTKGSVGFAPCQSRALAHVAKPPSFSRAPRTPPPVAIRAQDSSTVERTSAPGRVTATNCCDGTCPPCEKICSRTLPCGNHKCVSVCHRGLCYPCPLNEQVKCRCGNTAITVPCGRKRKTKPPRCNRQCKIEADCHHPKRENHKCHFGDCPPCRQVCGKVRADCPHPCPAPCHSAVWVRVDGDHKPAGPWEKVTPQLQMVDLPCPNCMVPIPVTCVGGHETCDWPCHRAKPSSCHRPCGRALSCGNHLCSLLCHTVTGAKDNVTSGNECEQCESGCTKPRPKGCSHPCTRPCHPDLCPPCSQMVRLPCHCALNQKYVRCGEWVLSDQARRVDMQSCGNQCPRNYPCSHRCRATCHPGDCPNPELCHKKVRIHCSCRRLRKEFPCDAVRAGQATLDCDIVCKQKKEEETKAKELEQLKQQMEVERKNQEEVERFQRKFQQRKKHKERHQQNSVVIYNASVAVSKARLPNWAEPFAVGLVAVLVDIPYDIVSVKFLHWTWHDTDPNIFDRHYWVPWNSYYFHAAFSASFIFWFHGWHRWVTSEDKWQVASWWRELFVAVMAALLGMPGGILLFIPIYHPLHDLFQVHTEVCVVLLLTGFFLIVWSADRNPIGRARPSTGTRSSGSDRRILLVLHLVQYYALFLGMTIFGDPQEEVSIGLHETTGPCDKIAYVRTPVGLELSKRKYLCVSNYSEDYYDFKCVPKGAPSEGKSWYTICGTPFTERAEYFAVISGICILAFVVFYQLHYRSGDGVSSKHRKTRVVNTKQKKH
uniref:NF-X1-type domain-containing protein n=1 Tax=Timema cristinae TaxID=61476 RepID=A0A7R9GZ98_TIMCR|nr:unnamed protein product [Timema cristinae]